jgi:hypothetical protein
VLGAQCTPVQLSVKQSTKRFLMQKTRAKCTFGD